jgi:hypothetical protein
MESYHLVGSDTCYGNLCGAAVSVSSVLCGRVVSASVAALTRKWYPGSPAICDLLFDAG